MRVNKLYKILTKADNLEINIKQLMLLMSLVENLMTPTQVANKLKISGASVTAMIDKLEQMRLVKRDHGSSDRRTIDITITQKGRELCDELIKA